MNAFCAALSNAMTTPPVQAAPSTKAATGSSSARGRGILVFSSNMPSGARLIFAEMLGCGVTPDGDTSPNPTRERDRRGKRPWNWP